MYVRAIDTLFVDMASGMTGLEADDPTAYTDPNSPYGLFEASLGLQPATPKTMKSTYRYIATLKRQKPSGQKYEYTSVNTFVCAWLAEKVSGKPYAELVSEMFQEYIRPSLRGLSSVVKCVKDAFGSLRAVWLVYGYLWGVSQSDSLTPSTSPTGSRPSFLTGEVHGDGEV